MEKDDELKGTGNSYDFGARIYDPRVGRWWAVDPLAGSYPGNSPYIFVLNNPLFFIDKDGKIVYDKHENAVVMYEDNGELIIVNVTLPEIG